jgi:integrase
MIAHAKAGGSPQADFFDEKEPGLVLRVSATGRKSWCFFYTRPRDNKRARITIGTYPALSLAGARGRAVEARGWVLAGHDPKSLLTGRGAVGMTMAGLVDAYLTDPDKAKRRSNPEVGRRLHRNVVPIIGGVRLVELRRRDVKNAINIILRRGAAVEAARVFEDVRGMIRWAVESEFLEVDPIGTMTAPGGSSPRSRVLSDAEICSLWNSLPNALARSKDCQRIIKLCLVTAQRVGEVAGMRCEELNLDAALWSLPGERTKNGCAHTVPLSNLALSIINEALVSAGDNAFVFPSDRGALPPHAVARTILRANQVSVDRQSGRFGVIGWSAHDLRRTALTGMAALGVAPIVLGHVANHRSVTRAGVTLSAYSQYGYDKEKRAALEQWAERLSAIVGAPSVAKVVPLRGRR